MKPDVPKAISIISGHQQISGFHHQARPPSLAMATQSVAARRASNAFPRAVETRLGANRGGLPPQTLHWSARDKIKVRICDLPKDVTTLEVADICSQEGKVVSIDLACNPDGSAKGVAFVIFSPPPRQDFWRSGLWDPFLVSRNQKPSLRVGIIQLAEPPFYKGLHSGKEYPECLTLTAASLEFGVLYGPEAMMPMYSTRSLPHIPITVRQILRSRQIEVCFPIQFRADRSSFPQKTIK